MKRLLFVVAGGTQWDDALRVAASVDGDSLVLDLQNIEAVGPPPPSTPYPGAHWPEQGYRRVLELTRTLRALMPSTAVVVIGQDAGRLQRVAARVARRSGVPVAVIPDGALFDSRATLPLDQQLQERMLSLARLTCGEPLRFGATHPDLWCAWGSGWTTLLQTFSPRGRVVVTGSPRAQDLASLPSPSPVPKRVLICSQPTWVHPFPQSSTAAAAWYSWVDLIVRSAPPDLVHVRFHPRERDIAAGLPLSEAVRNAATLGTTLAQDLADHDAVVAPYSTALIEAAAAGRAVVSVVPEAMCLPVRTASPATADARLTVLLPEHVGSYDALLHVLAESGAVSDWGSEYATISEETPERCAHALLALARDR